MNVEDAFDFGSTGFCSSKFFFDGINSQNIFEQIHHHDKHHQTHNRHNSNKSKRFGQIFENDNSSFRDLTPIARITFSETFTQRRTQQRTTSPVVFTLPIFTIINFSFAQFSFAIARTRTTSLFTRSSRTIS